MSFFQIKKFSLVCILVNKVLGTVSDSESNLDVFKDIGNVCLKVVLFFRIGTLRVSVTLSIWSINEQKLYSP